MSSSVRTYQHFDDFLAANEPLRQAFRSGRVGVVSPEEGNTQFKAHVDMSACLEDSQGKTLSALVKERLTKGTIEAPAATTPAATTPSHVHRRRPR